MDDHAADGGFAGFLHRPPFDAVPAMEAMLRRAGYRGIGTTQRVAEVRYASPDAWWEASWNQAPALFWEKIPEPLPPSAPAARPGCSRPGAASSTANPLNALRSAGYAMLLSLTSSAALKAGIPAATYGRAVGSRFIGPETRKPPRAATACPAAVLCQVMQCPLDSYRQFEDIMSH